MLCLKDLALLLVLAGVFLAPAVAQNRPIETEIAVEGATQLKPLLESVSDAVRMRETGAPSVGAVKRIAAKDAERFAQALSSQGFYSPTIESDAAATENGFKASFKISTGPYYKVTSHLLRYTDEGPANRPSNVAETGAALNDSGRGTDIVAIERDLIARMQASGYPLARVVDRVAEIEEGTTNARVVYLVASGRKAKFGATEWLGRKRTRASYLDTFLTWKPGETYDLDKTTAMRDELAQTGLFTRVEVKPGDIDPEGNAPVLVEMTERRVRTVSAGLSYSTNLGPGVATSWVHRNVFGSAEKLTAEVSFAEVKRLSALTFEKPRVTRRTDFLSKLSAVHEDDDAFRGKLVTASAGLSHRFGKSLIASAGVELSSSTTVDAFGSRRSNLFGVPVGATWTNIKDLLDPKRGLALALTVTPNVGASNGPIFFTTVNFSSRYHWPFDTGDKFIGALWTHVGASLGPNTAEIPPDKRFYAGGAGSVRGYGYRLLGPSDPTGKPIGGRSVLEGGVELRFPVVRKIGGAIFFEVGGVDETGIFTFAEGIRESVGLGARYQTPIGPIRLDVAVPLARRGERDEPVQIYVGLGQAF